ncbi:MAG TPA: Holliday junction branch migration protein RuvA [Thiotrichaceae bacterium]|jgi:Holliday junction DNA helicase RuvA|nr:Holliday junction branch migration protein RuvA [Thiotrichaceae bacterium]HIM07567.1 Holliday junction branch migration protein RuvA [Gammaproteobacteria bacterium]
MIGYLRGVIIKKQPPLLLLDVQGVGYEIEAPMTTFYALPEVKNEVEIYTHLIIRDDAHLLFGFATENERHMFRTLIKVNGVGAKMGLTILSGMEANEFASCVKNNDIDRLVKLPGVGKKTAERLIVEMKDRLEGFGDSSVTTQSSNTKTINTDPVNEAVSALIGLGYKPQEASKFVLAVANDDMTSEELIREALKNSVKK